MNLIKITIKKSLIMEKRYLNIDDISSFGYNDAADETSIFMRNNTHYVCKGNIESALAKCITSITNGTVMTI